MAWDVSDLVMARWCCLLFVCVIIGVSVLPLWASRMDDTWLTRMNDGEEPQFKEMQKMMGILDSMYGRWNVRNPGGFRSFGRHDTNSMWKKRQWRVLRKRSFRKYDDIREPLKLRVKQ